MVSEETKCDWTLKKKKTPSFLTVSLLKHLLLMKTVVLLKMLVKTQLKAGSEMFAYCTVCDFYMEVN